MEQDTSGGMDRLKREPPSILEERLRTCLRERYGLDAQALTLLPGGRDFDAGVFRVETVVGEAYVLKATTRPLYTPSCLAPRYLNEQGIAEVVALRPTASGELWVTLGAWRVTVYPYLDGETSWTGMTSAYWRTVGDIFRRIHALRPSPEQLGELGPLRREAFDPTGYIERVRTFEAEQLAAGGDGSEAVCALRAAWGEHQSEITAIMTALETLAAALDSRTMPYVLCHADLHAANLLRDARGRVFVIDWDEVMLAPRERDFIFLWDSSPSDAFWEGYGERTIDWMALAYFQYERVIQDVIEDARQVYFHDDLREGVREEIARTFGASFALGGNLDAAYAAAAQLLPELGISRAVRSVGDGGR